MKRRAPRTDRDAASHAPDRRPDVGGSAGGVLSRLPRYAYPAQHLAIFTTLRRFVQLRGALRALTGIHRELQRQNLLLERLANHFVPALPTADHATVRADTGVSYLDPTETALAYDYIARTKRDTGAEPTDEDVLIYLADEKTRDMHLRLAERDQQIERLARDRQDG
jgi:hypothetical protein